MASRVLETGALRRLRRIWKEDVQRLTLADLKGLGSTAGGLASQLEVAQRTHLELKVRLAHRLRDFLFLPYTVMSHPSIRQLFENYVGAYNMHEDFGQVKTPAAAAEYWRALAATFERHANVTRLLGHGRRQLVRHDPELAPVLDRFISRFFVSRISTRLLGAHFLNLGPVPHGGRKPAGIAMSVLQPTSPVRLINNLSLSLSASAHGDYVPVDVEDGMRASILHIPGHLRYVLRELLENAIVATARLAAKRGCDPPPIRVKVNRGQFGVFVTISDQGGGIASMDHVWRWGEHQRVLLGDKAFAVGAELDWTSGDDEGLHPGSVPLGFGLPLARLTARYFGGDIRLQTLMGYGTSAYVHIQELQQEGAEVDDDAGS